MKIKFGAHCKPHTFTKQDEPHRIGGLVDVSKTGMCVTGSVPGITCPDEVKRAIDMTGMMIPATGTNIYPNVAEHDGHQFRIEIEVIPGKIIQDYRVLCATEDDAYIYKEEAGWGIVRVYPKHPVECRFVGNYRDHFEIPVDMLKKNFRLYKGKHASYTSHYRRKTDGKKFVTMWRYQTTEPSGFVPVGEEPCPVTEIEGLVEAIDWGMLEEEVAAWIDTQENIDELPGPSWDRVVLLTEKAHPVYLRVCVSRFGKKWGESLTVSTYSEDMRYGYQMRYWPQNREWKRVSYPKPVNELEWGAWTGEKEPYSFTDPESDWFGILHPSLMDDDHREDYVRLSGDYERLVVLGSDLDRYFEKVDA